MYELLLCHRCARSAGRTVLREHWRTVRAPLVATLKDALGYEYYGQLHRASRLNPLYLGILASRSWPLTALFSVVQGLPLPKPFRRADLADERWDAVELFRYGSREALVAALTSEAGLAAARRLAADAIGLVRYGAAVISEVVPVYDDPALRWPRTATVFCLRARPPMTRAQMLERWRTAHRELVLSLQPGLGYRNYDQLHAREEPELASAIGAFGVTESTFDGVAVLAYGSQRELLARLFSPATQFANLKLVRDEVNFIDGRNSALVFGEVELVAVSEALRSPDEPAQDRLASRRMSSAAFSAIM